MLKRKREIQLELVFKILSEVKAAWAGWGVWSDHMQQGYTEDEDDFWIINYMADR